MEYGLNVLTDANCLAFYTWSINGSSLIFPLNSIIISAIPGAPKETNLPYRLKINFIWSAPDGWQIWIGSKDQVIILQNYYSSRKHPLTVQHYYLIYGYTFCFQLFGSILIGESKTRVHRQSPSLSMLFFAARSPPFWPHSRLFEYL